MRLLILALFFALPKVGAAADRIEWWSFSAISHMEISRSHQFGGGYQIIFFNDTAHYNDGDYVLTLDDFEVRVLLDWEYQGGQAEMITVLPPEGYLAVPVEIVVPEGKTVTIQIMPGLS